MKKPLPELAYILKVLNYDPCTGVFTWQERDISQFKNSHRMKVFNSKHAGKEAGCLSPDGYIYIRLKGSSFLAHRIAWKILTGEDPEDEVDHENRIRRDNRASNLRPAEPTQNRCNTDMRYNNTTGLKGAVYDPKLKKYRAAIGHRNKKYYLGLYESAEAAHEAYRTAAERLHGGYVGVLRA